MENVYVIKVKTKPPLSSLYPSERRYSASTVGGLSFVHFGLGALSLLLGTLALSLQGPILSVACLVPFVTGLLAWRRWYIDRNITIFFYGSLFSLVAAVLCFVVTVFDIAATSNSSRTSLFSLENILDSTREILPAEERFKETDFNATDFGERLKNETVERYDEIRKVHSTDVAENFNGDSYTKERMNLTDRTEEVKDKVIFWRKSYDSSQTKMLLTLNVLVASLLEFLWSLLSAKIALKGMMNRLPETSYGNNAVAATKAEGVTAQKRKPPAPRPDILEHDRRLSGSLQNLNSLQSFGSGGPRLPLPESTREFRERVERFLANQAAHRVVEGSFA